MATKTQNLEKALLLEGFVKVDHRSTDPCFVKDVILTVRTTGKKVPSKKYIWLLTGCIRGGYSDKRTEAKAMPKFAEYLLSQHGWN